MLVVNFANLSGGSVAAPHDPILADGFKIALSQASVPVLVICCVLLVLSSIAWTLLVTKHRAVSKMRRASGQFLDLFRSSKEPLSAYSSGVLSEDAPLFHVYQAGCQELSCQVMGESDVDYSYSARMRGAGKISPTQMNVVQLALERAGAEQVQNYEKGTTLISTAVSAAPFVGVLGTVWGMIDMFVGEVAAGVGTVTMTAGLSSALVTTVVALMVAIPAMFGYRFLVHRIKSAVVEIDDFSAEFYGMVDRHYVEHRMQESQIVPSEEKPRNRATRSSAHSLMLDRPEGEPRKENARRATQRVKRKSVPKQPSLLDDVGELEPNSPTASDSAETPITPPAPALEKTESKRPSMHTMRVRATRPKPSPPNPAPPAKEESEPVYDLTPEMSARPKPAAAPEGQSHHSGETVGDLIAAEKKKGAGILLRALRRTPKRREPAPAEL